MALYAFHRVLIGSAVLFAWGLAYFLYRRHGQVDQIHYLLMSLISAAVGTAMLAYLIYFNRVTRALQAKMDGGASGR